MSKTYTFNIRAQAHNMTRTGFVTIPDQVYADQEAFDGATFPAIYNGRKVRARLRGDEYGLHSSGTGDPVVAIVSGAAASKMTDDPTRYTRAAVAYGAQLRKDEDRHRWICTMPNGDNCTGATREAAAEIMCRRHGLA